MRVLSYMQVLAIRWLLERELPEPAEPCNRCGHDANHHHLDDSTNVSPTDPHAKFRCVWPMSDGPAVYLCDCPDYVTLPGGAGPHEWNPTYERNTT